MKFSPVSDTWANEKPPSAHMTRIAGMCYSFNRHPPCQVSSDEQMAWPGTHSTSWHALIPDTTCLLIQTIPYYCKHLMFNFIKYFKKKCFLWGYNAFAKIWQAIALTTYIYQRIIQQDTYQFPQPWNPTAWRTCTANWQMYTKKKTKNLKELSLLKEKERKKWDILIILAKQNNKSVISLRLTEQTSILYINSVSWLYKPPGNRNFQKHSYQIEYNKHYQKVKHHMQNTVVKKQTKQLQNKLTSIVKEVQETRFQTIWSFIH